MPPRFSRPRPAPAAVPVSAPSSGPSWFSLVGRLLAWGFVLVLVSSFLAPRLAAQAFTHPGGLHTLADLERMKAKVAAGESPWIEGWNRLITDSRARKTYTAAARADMGANRQRASADAHAAYLNTIRWYVSGDTEHADTAVAICNAWSAAVDRVPGGDSLVGIPIFDFAMAGEVLRTYPGWAAADFARFQDMMRLYLYPRCRDFLLYHNGACISNSWANWDICNYGALIAMGVLLDDAEIFEEGVDYFKYGAGMGSIMNAVPYLHPGGLGQWQESGRDQPHAQLGVGMMAAACQIAWNQGVDLFAYADNRLLAGAEYVARTNLSQPVPYTYYTNCQNANQSWLSLNGLGRLDDRPVWELVYNHYVVRRGLDAPHVRAMAQLMRPEHGSNDHFGYGTLTFTLDAAASPHPPLPVPAAPTGLRATAGVSRVTLDWDVSPDDAAQGYRVQRATAPSGPYVTIATWTENTRPHHIDTTAINGVAYHYRVAAINQSGTSLDSSPAPATPVAAVATLPAGWLGEDVGTVGAAGGTAYADVAGGTFRLSTTGGGIGGSADAGFHYAHTSVMGDFTFTARLSHIAWNGGGGRVGLMMRESLAADSRTVVLTLGDTGNRQARAGFRTTPGGNLNNYGGNDYTWTPAWFRLQRTGNTFTAYESSDGIAWFAIRSANLAMAATYHVGFFATTGNAATATFDHVFSGLTSDPVVTPDHGRIDLAWLAPEGGASGYVIRRAVGDGPFSILADDVSETHYADHAVSAAGVYRYTVAALAPDGGSGPASAAVTAAPLGLRTRLDFEHTADDAVGTLHGALSGSPAYVAGRHGRALVLDGIDDFGVLPPDALPAPAYPAFSLAVWVYWEGGGQWQRLVDFGTGTAAYFFITPRSGDNTLRFAIKNGGGEQRLDAPQLVTGKWIHLAVTLGEGVGRLYIDGVLAATNATMSLRPADIAPRQNFLGKSQFSADPLFAGRIDDFRLHNFVLDAAEIAALATPFTALESWKVAHGLDAAQDVAAAPDGDGLPLLLKYATGLSPGVAAVSPITLADDVEDALALSFPRVAPAPLTYEVQASDDLLVWSPIATLAPAANQWTGPALVEEAGENALRLTTVHDPAPRSESPRRFLRLEVSAP